MDNCFEIGDVVYQAEDPNSSEAITFIVEGRIVGKRYTVLKNWECDSGFSSTKKLITHCELEFSTFDDNRWVEVGWIFKSKEEAKNFTIKKFQDKILSLEKKLRLYESTKNII